MQIPNTTKAQISRLEKLQTLLWTYAHRWGGDPSARMGSWVLEYDLLKEKLCADDAWEEYCRTAGLDPSHDAYDCMA